MEKNNYLKKCLSWILQGELKEWRMNNWDEADLFIKHGNKNWIMYEVEKV